MTSTPHDLVVFGATSFAGQILCRHLVDRHGTDGDLRWAIAGRDDAKLERVAAETGASVARIVADAHDRDALDRLCADTSVVVSTVGPFARYGSDLVAAVVDAGIGYCDLTGETHWMRRMIDEHGDAATASGARVVHACGFDSIPSDLGVLYTQERAIELLGEPCSDISMRVKALKGGPSGGTVATMVNVVAEVRADPELRRILGNPYALAPDGLRRGVRQPDIRTPTRDPHTGAWVGPFMMAAVNTRVVHRTHALLGHPWGEDFRYDEAMVLGHGPVGAVRASGLTAGLVGFLGAAAIPPVRGLLQRHVLPKPGEGPDEAAREAGFYDLRFFGTTRSGATISTMVRGDRDPGYGSSARLLGEAAHALVEEPGTPDAGVWTPATAFGSGLIDRLTEHAGMSFSVL